MVKSKHSVRGVFWVGDLTISSTSATLEFVMPENTIPEEIRSKAVAAAEAVYRLSEAANFDPALKFELRKISSGILSRVAGLALGFSVKRREEIQGLLADAAAIQELIRFAAARLYIVPQNAERVLAAYSRISARLAKIGAAENAESVHITPLDTGLDKANLNERQRRIMEFLASNGRVQIGDIRQIFGETASEKTLQRDLWQLADSGLIRRHGDNRWTTYSLGH